MNSNIMPLSYDVKLKKDTIELIEGKVFYQERYMRRNSGAKTQYDEKEKITYSKQYYICGASYQKNGKTVLANCGASCLVYWNSKDPKMMVRKITPHGKKRICIASEFDYLRHLNKVDYKIIFPIIGEMDKDGRENVIQDFIEEQEENKRK